MTDEEYIAPPHNLECEQALLGALLVNNEVALKIDPNLKPEDFYEPVHGRIFDACLRLINSGQRADPVKLKPFFEGDDALKDVGGASYLVRLASSAATIINAPDYTQTIIENSDRRKIILLADDMIAKAHMPAFEGTRDTQNFIEETLAELRNERLRDGKLMSMADAVDDNNGEIDAALRSGVNVGIRTGIEGFDNLVGGLRAGHLILIAGRPAMGKTALLLEIQRNTAMLGHGSITFSMEMEGEELSERMTSSFTAETTEPIEYEKMSDVVNMNPLDLENWYRAAEKSKALPVYIRTGRATVASIRRAARATRAKLEAQGKTLDIIFVDYIGKMHGTNAAKKRGRYEEITEISGDLKDLAEELGVPMVVAAQLNRDLEKRDDKTPQISDLRDSGSLEQDANVIIFPFREEVYINKEKVSKKDWVDWDERMSHARGKMKIILAKKRRGKLGSVTLNANMGCNRIYD